MSRVFADLIFRNSGGLRSSPSFFSDLTIRKLRMKDLEMKIIPLNRKKCIFVPRARILKKCGKVSILCSKLHNSIPLDQRKYIWTACKDIEKMWKDKCFVFRVTGNVREKSQGPTPETHFEIYFGFLNTFGKNCRVSPLGLFPSIT